MSLEKSTFAVCRRDGCQGWLREGKKEKARVIEGKPSCTACMHSRVSILVGSRVSRASSSCSRTTTVLLLQAREPSVLELPRTRSEEEDEPGSTVEMQVRVSASESAPRTLNSMRAARTRHANFALHNVIRRCCAAAQTRWRLHTRRGTCVAIAFARGSPLSQRF